MAKLTDDLKQRIIADWKAGVSQNQLAKRYDVSPATINKLCKFVDGTNGLNKYHSYAEKPFNGSKDGFIYVIYFKDSGGVTYYKIGLASDVKNRIKQHQTSTPFNVYIAISYYVEDMRIEESILHEMFNDVRILGEWFLLNDENLIKIKERSLRIF